MTFLAWDTETHLIAPGHPYARLVCVSWSTPENPRGGVLNAEDGFTMVRDAIRSGRVIVGHNIFYDLGVLAVAAETRFGEDPTRFLRMIFDAAVNGQIRDTQIREQLIDISRGWFRRRIHDDGFVESRNYSLADLARRRTRHELIKDTWRLRYAELDGVPLSQWPEAAIEYARLDAVATREVFESQARDDGIPLGAEVGDERNQVQKAWWLSLMSAWGLRTDEGSVAGLKAHIGEQAITVAETLKGAGLMRSNGVRDTKATAARMVAACLAEGLQVPRTKTARKKLQAGEAVSDDVGIALDEDACNATEDPILHDYALFSKLQNVMKKDVPMFEKGVITPIHSRFSLVETGRVASTSPNVMNLKSGVDKSCSCRWDETLQLALCPYCKGKKKISLLGNWGIRECFVPRQGFVFMQADFPGLELRTLAQFCKTVLGHSELAIALNGGMDVHLKLAADLVGVDYTQAKVRFAAGDDRVKAARKLAKIANFGLPGGMSDPAFCSWAAGAGFEISPTRAAELRRAWLRTWPEMVQYFALMRRRVGPRGSAGARFTHLFTGRRRAQVRYTAACNSEFQGLGSDATGAAGFLISRAMYTDPSSPLFGSHLVNYVHDEFIGEVREDRASAAVLELCRLMRDGANLYLPDVPFSEISPVLMRRWSKNAETRIGARGEILPWEEKACA